MNCAAHSTSTLYCGGSIKEHSVCARDCADYVAGTNVLCFSPLDKYGINPQATLQRLTKQRNESRSNFPPRNSLNLLRLRSKERYRLSVYPYLCADVAFLSMNDYRSLRNGDHKLLKISSLQTPHPMVRKHWNAGEKGQRRFVEPEGSLRQQHWRFVSHPICKQCPCEVCY